ncbi:MAG TPA: cupin domain-containing protein [Vicinamibacterales bacterium]|jgi:mannose-6-phosphate isomerase-like protein (cupin superfamily)|nr:cupin domain-containing protein [Vicinamibacterales bacterium]
MSTAATPRASGGGTTVKHRTDITLLMQVDRWDPRVDGPLTEAALQQKLKNHGYDPLPRSNPTGAIVSARVHHRHRAEAVLSGLLRVTIDDESVILTDGDIVFVPAGAARRIEPVGSAPVLCIEAVDRSTRA